MPWHPGAGSTWPPSSNMARLAVQPPPRPSPLHHQPNQMTAWCTWWIRGRTGRQSRPAGRRAIAPSGAGGICWTLPDTIRSLHSVYLQGCPGRQGQAVAPHKSQPPTRPMPVSHRPMRHQGHRPRCYNRRSHNHHQPPPSWRCPGGQLEAEPCPTPLSGPHCSVWCGVVAGSSWSRSNYPQSAGPISGTQGHGSTRPTWTCGWASSRFSRARTSPCAVAVPRWARASSYARSDGPVAATTSPGWSGRWRGSRQPRCKSGAMARCTAAAWWWSTPGTSAPGSSWWRSTPAWWSCSRRMNGPGSIGTSGRVSARITWPNGSTGSTAATKPHTQSKCRRCGSGADHRQRKCGSSGSSCARPWGGWPRKQAGTGNWIVRIVCT